MSRAIAERGDGTRDYVWLGGLPVAVIDAQGTSTLRTIHADHLGTLRVIVDGEGKVVWSWSLHDDPFGENAPTSTSGYAFHLRFAGQYYDQETGLHCNLQRYYDPMMGRYLTSDPLGLRRSLVYCLGGTESDDPGEPYWLDVAGGHIRDAWSKPWEFIQEAGSAGAMRIGLLLGYCGTVVLVVLAWWFSRHIPPVLITLGALSIIVGKTIWLIVLIAKQPKDFAGKAKSWWRVIWDAFWGL